MIMVHKSSKCERCAIALMCIIFASNMISFSVAVGNKNDSEDLYQVLGLERGADISAVKKAYRELVSILIRFFSLR